ncbi:hypothetical protein SAY86_009977 [Trapa natans]|uniref:Uncharacterized protein n=1 Tax=Trapa natans TaxID=22666 RepID=A0AAN7L5T2_TRANT|nr:hypothetical protein SAY86_009977 [Trapa natans]
MLRGLSSPPSALVRLPNRHNLPPLPRPLSSSLLFDPPPSRSFSSSSCSPSDSLLGNLEEAIHRIIVRRSEPDWIPFRPGSSYWVPPRSKFQGVAKLIGRLTAGGPRLNAMSTTNPRGWPSSSYFIHGKSPAPRPVEAEKASNDASQPEDEE